VTDANLLSSVAASESASNPAGFARLNFAGWVAITISGLASTVALPADAWRSIEAEGRISGDPVAILSA
jgi:hypothetical protein